jgi:hypothetical protein
MRIFTSIFTYYCVTFVWEEMIEGKSCAEGRSSNKQEGAEDYVSWRTSWEVLSLYLSLNVGILGW